MWTLIFNALKSPNFWQSLISMAGSFGVTLDPEQANAIVGMALAGVSVCSAFKHVKEQKIAAAKT